jgi:hypothetical protein
VGVCVGVFVIVGVLVEAGVVPQAASVPIMLAENRNWAIFLVTFLPRGAFPHSFLERI